MASLFDEPDELTDDEERDLFEQFVRDSVRDFPRRMEIKGRMFQRDAYGLYTNLEDPDDDRIFELDPETGELFQWPDCD
jgi:hypothetical protein